ncbi:hypothetical protein LIA77_10356 [Sarocladium implicatum]|nr:hypothetical protein LIA77_10356 [Sarocladium implicatum]
MTNETTTIDGRIIPGRRVHVIRTTLGGQIAHLTKKTTAINIDMTVPVPTRRGETLMPETTAKCMMNRDVAKRALGAISTTTMAEAVAHAHVRGTKGEAGQEARREMLGSPTTL